MRRQRRRNLKRRTDQHSLALDAPSGVVVRLQDRFGREHQRQLMWGEVQRFKEMDMQPFDEDSPQGRLAYERRQDKFYQPIGPWRPR